jgi:hypothetical protein
MTLLSLKLVINVQSVTVNGPHYIDFSPHKPDITASETASSDKAITAIHSQFCCFVSLMEHPGSNAVQ